MAASSLSPSRYPQQTQSPELTCETTEASTELSRPTRSHRTVRRAAVYARQRDSFSEVESSLDELCEVATSHSWKVRFQYADVVPSDGEGLPVLEALLQDARAGCFEALLVRRLSDLAQSPIDLGRLLDRLDGFQVVFASQQDGIETSGGGAVALIAALRATDRLGRELASEKAAAALARARVEKRTLGRPKARLDRRRLLGLAARGMSLRQMARLLKTSKSTVARALKRMDLSIE